MAVDVVGVEGQICGLDAGQMVGFGQVLAKDYPIGIDVVVKEKFGKIVFGNGRRYVKVEITMG